MSLILSGSDGVSDIDGTVSTPAIRGTDANTGIFFPAADTIAFTEGGVESMRIDSSGNVQIGTTTAVGRLTVTAPASTEYGCFDAPTAGYAFLRLRYNGNPYGSFGQAQAVISGGSATDFGLSASNNLIFGTSGSTERMRIDSSGRLLVGLTSSTSNGGQIQASAIGQTGVVTFTNTTAGNNALYFENPNGIVGSIQTSGSATAYNTSSDYRLKENVAPMTGALAKVALLKPCTYTWKIDGFEGQGFIAHELAEVVPDCVSGEKDAVETYTDEDGNEQTRIKAQGIDTSFLVATLTAAIQELKAIVDAQAIEIAELKAK